MNGCLEKPGSMLMLQDGPPQHFRADAATG
jgi:hypothetical protein